MAIFDKLLQGFLKGAEKAAPAAGKVEETLAAPVAGQTVHAAPAAAPAAPAAVPAVAPAAVPAPPVLPALDELKALVKTPVDTMARQTSPGPGPRNFNLTQYDPTSFESPEQAMATIQSLAARHVEKNPNFNDVRTWAEVHERAQNYTYEELIGESAKGVRIFDDAQTYAGVQLLGGMSEQLAKQSRYVADALESGALTEADKLAYLATAARAKTLHELLAGSVKEAARSTSILRATKAARFDTPSAVAQTQKLLAELGGDDMVAGIADAMNLNISPAAALRQVRELQKLAGWGDLVREYAINNMMSAPTHLKNLGGNTVAISDDMLIEGPLRAMYMQGIRRARGEYLSPAMVNQQYAAEALIKIEGAARATGTALRAFLANVMEDSATIANMGKFTDRPRAISASNVQRLMQTTFGVTMEQGWKLGAVNFAGRVARRHTTLLAAEDALFKTMVGRAEAYATAYRTARQAGMGHIEARAEAGTQVHNLTAAQWAEIDSKTADLTFNTELPRRPYPGVEAKPVPGSDPIRGIGGALGAALDGNPWSKFLTLPFLRVSTNLLSWIYKRIPGIGLIQNDTALALRATMKPMLDDMTHVELGTEAAAKVLAQQTVGAAITLWAWNQTELKNIVGQLGFDTQGVRDARKMRVQPNSVIVRDDEGNVTGSYSTQGFDPIVGLINVTSTARETYMYAKTEEDAQTALAAITWGWGKALLDRGYLQGLTKWIDLVEGPQPAGQKLVKFGVAAATPMFPGYGDLRRLAQTPENDIRDDGRYPLPIRGGAENVHVDAGSPASIVNAILTEVQARSPYFNKSLLPNVNGWGQDMMSWGSYIERNVSPSVYVPMDPKESGPRDDILWRNGINHPTVSPTLTFGLAQIDIRDLKVEGKPDGYAWYTYQKSVGAARRAIVDPLARMLPKGMDATTNAPGTNRKAVESALTRGLAQGQATWSTREDIMQALTAAGVNPAELTDPARARESLPGMENVRPLEFGP